MDAAARRDPLRNIPSVSYDAYAALGARKKLAVQNVWNVTARPVGMAPASHTRAKAAGRTYLLAAVWQASPAPGLALGR